MGWEYYTASEMVLVTTRPREGCVRELLRQLQQLHYAPQVIPAVTLSYTHQLTQPLAVIVDAAFRDVQTSGTVLANIRGIWEQAPVLLFAERQIANRLRFDSIIHDFLILPITVPDLEARLRFTAMKMRGAVPRSEVIEVAGLSMNLHSREVTVDRKLIEFTYKEFELLCFLLQHQRQVHTRDDLLRAVWETEYYGDTRTVDMHIRRLRAKLGDRIGVMIHTVRNVGYRFG